MENQSLHQPSGIKSIWKTFASETSFPALSGDIQTEIAIIGGGITGITTAQLLKEAGFKVTVLEARKVGGGSTGHSTGNLYAMIEQGFETIKDKYDLATVRAIAQGRKNAVDFIEANVDRFAITCDFRRQPWISYAATPGQESKLETEYQEARACGLSASKLAPGDIPFTMVSGVRVENQAQFNPLRYVQQLAMAIADEDCVIYENTPAVSINEEEINAVIETDNGRVFANYVIHATHTPKGLMVDFHSVLGPYREYGVAARLASGQYPEGTFWGYYNVNDRFSIRTYDHDGEQRVIVVGQPHKVGTKEDNWQNITHIENFIREQFDVAEFTHRWGAQNYKPADALPYIGYRSEGSRILLATGFSSDGLTYGTLAAMVLRDILIGTETTYTKLFDSTRHNPAKAAAKVIKENISNAGEIIKDYIFFKDANLTDIPETEGKVIEVDGKKVAVYHESNGVVKACSAICTHMGCVVHWNNAERTWDCPCHASRFDTDGSIIEGPALTPLAQVDILNVKEDF
ncbi:MAG: FAD-dependent oxidoreductase [Flavobacterium sp.]|nr:FAD-dependent oxidoreductase [Flavobacterium sp.]